MVEEEKDQKSQVNQQQPSSEEVPTNDATQENLAGDAESSQEEEEMFFGSLSDIMTATSRAVQELKHNLEPKEEFRFLARVLKEAAINDRMGKDQPFAEYLYETLAL